MEVTKLLDLERSLERKNGLNGENLNNLPHQNQQKCVKIQS
jgi:hypothetical protein